MSSSKGRKERLWCPQCKQLYIAKRKTAFSQETRDLCSLLRQLCYPILCCIYWTVAWRPWVVLKHYDDTPILFQMWFPLSVWMGRLCTLAAATVWVPFLSVRTVQFVTWISVLVRVTSYCITFTTVQFWTIDQSTVGWLECTPGLFSNELFGGNTVVLFCAWALFGLKRKELLLVVFHFPVKLCLVKECVEAWMGSGVEMGQL